MTYSQALPTAYAAHATSNDSASLDGDLRVSGNFSSGLMSQAHNDHSECEAIPDSHCQMPAILPLSTSVEHAVRRYFSALEGETSSDLYDLILSQVERPLLIVALEHSQGNQSKCAAILGLNRGTLRKKLKAYNLID